jgi:serine/threonine protein kinase
VGLASRQGEADASDSLLIKMIDFGVAKITEAGVDQTQAGFVGTPGFASPEQRSNSKSCLSISSMPRTSQRK